MEPKLEFLRSDGIPDVDCRVLKGLVLLFDAGDILIRYRFLPPKVIDMPRLLDWGLADICYNCFLALDSPRSGPSTDLQLRGILMSSNLFFAV